jgi:predicted nuclease of predicted toxin-antitoxin system
MNFLVDAGCDALHTLDFPTAIAQPTKRSTTWQTARNAWVVTKDTHFVDSHVLRGRPEKLLLITTGNISNRDLEALIVPFSRILLNSSRHMHFSNSGELVL